MDFKKIVLSLIISASMGTAYAATVTADGTVNINGTVVSQTCTVDDDSKNITVPLPTVGSTSLKADGAVGGATPFHINVIGCSVAGAETGKDNETKNISSLTKIGIYFSGININNDNGTLNNVSTSNPAKNVNVQLLNKDSTPIDLSKSSDSQGISFQNLTDEVEGVLTFNFAAQYYATGQSEPGDVQATVPFVIVYQ